MPKRTATPRASLTCTVLDDQDWMALQQDAAGREACHLFVSLLVAAKAQGNGGKFTAAPPLVALMVRWPTADYLAALKTLTSRTNWVTSTEGGSVTIRSWKKWNSGWGGKRTRAGRKKVHKRNQVGIQEGNSRGIKTYSPDTDTDTVSDSDSSATQKEEDPPNGGALFEEREEKSVPKKRKRHKYTGDFEAFWKLFPAARHGDKPKAFTEWKRMAEEERLAATHAASNFGRVHPTQITFIKHAERWLRGERWNEDEAYWLEMAEPNGGNNGAKHIHPKVSEDSRRGMDYYTQGNV